MCVVTPPSISPSAVGCASKPVGFARNLAAFGRNDALIAGDTVISYQQLAERVADAAARLGERRRLVLLSAANNVDSVVSYLAVLASGNPAMIAPGNPGIISRLVDAYDPDVVIDASRGGVVFDERRQVSRHQLHEDLALMLSTSGTTGSVKLVRLSHENLIANAEAIADYLAIRATDRAATTLPMHYCYGLSVINSYLLQGAALILTDLSVSDPAFWRQFEAHWGTSLAGVPYTFDLLDTVGFENMALPHLRYVTQAGGRLEPDRVRRYAEAGRRAGWELFVMYGQTEATARMAFLPPELCAEHPQAIGIPIPGGEFRIEPLPDWPDSGTGELVYRGPNVMLGYAEDPSDLALGRTQDELRTGDIARRNDVGLYEIVGRRSRFLKLFGLRVDLGQVEELLQRHGFAAACAGDDRELVVGVAAPAAEASRLHRMVAEHCGLPARVVRVVTLAEIPRLDSGKPDYPAIKRMAGAAPPAGPADDLRTLYGQVLGVAEVSEDDSFVDLGGDSLSYVEMTMRLERVIGRLPDQWHTLPIKRLRTAAPSRPSRMRSLETSVALRAISIFLVVGTHINLFWLTGGAHILMGVAGYNFGRFHLAVPGRGERVKRALRGVWRIVAASVVWIGLLCLVYRKGPSAIAGGGEYWFIEALVVIMAGVTAIMALPLLDRVERRWRFGLPLALVLAGLLTRYGVVPQPPMFHLNVSVADGITTEAWTNPFMIFWIFALGWATAKASTTWQRVCVTVAVLATVPGFFPHSRQDIVVAAGLILLVWVRSIPSTRALNWLVAMVASSSLYIYLTHWQVYPRLAAAGPLASSAVAALLITAATIAFGIGYHAATTFAFTKLRRLWGRGRAVAGGPTPESLASTP